MVVAPTVERLMEHLLVAEGPLFWVGRGVPPSQEHA